MAEITQKLGFDAQQAIQTLDKLTTSLNGADAALTKMNTSVSGAQALDKVEKGTKKATKASREFTVSWKTIIRVLQTQLIVRGLNTLISSLKEGIENARELGLAIEEVRTIDALGRTAEDINKAVLRLSDAIGQAPTDLAEGLYQTLSNQVVEAADSFQFMAEAARLAKVTASETGDAVNALSSVMNSYSLASSEAEHVAGTLFATVEQGRLRLSEIANVIGRVTPLTAQLGITWEETAASIATMTRQGVRADTAITQLRAVVTRLLKPTAEMSAIFRKWGVEDGRQAILTFGGLTGVLKKLGEETGHNSGEMAELLRNVRAVAGVFGIMNNEGKTMEEVLGHIEVATKKATEAWAEFAKSDAQKLTVEMQKFENLITRVGSKSLPFVTTAINGLVTGLEGLGTGIAIVSGNWGEAEQAAARYERAVARGAREGLALQKEQADAGRGQYDVLTEASRLYYAEANKLENQLADTRDNAIAGATAAFEVAADNLTNLYKDSLQEIERFADDAAGNVEKTFDRIAGVQQTIEDEGFAFRLRHAEDFYDKIAILDEQHQQASKKRAEAGLKITADPETEKAFVKASDREIKIREQIRDLIEKEKLGTKAVADAHTFVADAQLTQIEGLKKSVEFSQVFADNMEEVKNKFTGIEAQMELINERKKEIHADNIIDPNEEVELKNLNIEAAKLTQEFKDASAALKPGGLDIDFNKVVDGLTEALNQAHKDWEAEVARAKSTFAKAVIPIKISLDPEGVRAELQKVIGQEQIPGESQGAFAARGDLAAQQTLEKEKELTDQIKKARVEGLAPLKETQRTLGGITQQQSESVAQVQKNFELSQGLHGIWSSRREFTEKGLESDRKSVLIAGELNTLYNSILETLKDEGTVQAGALVYLERATEEALENKNITQEQSVVYDKILGQFREQIKNVERINELEDQRAPEEEVEAANALLDVSKEQTETTKLEAEQQQAIKDLGPERLKELLNIKDTSEDVADATENTADATSNASTEAGNFTANISQSLTPLAAALEQTLALASAMAAAASSAASISPSGPSGDTATAYHGGPHYAAGGMFRGQDRQLTALARGETVVNRKQSRRFFSELNAMNQGSQPVYRDQGGPVTNVGDVNVTVQGGDSSQQTVREIGHALRREVKRGNLSLR